MPTVAELIAAGKVRLRQATTISVSSTAPTRLLPANPMRSMLVLANSEANAARVGRNGGISATKGTPLAAEGGALVYTREYLGHALGGEWYSILATADGELYVEEYEAFE